MKKKGFTLIELLVVISVLALLASIVFSNLGGAREGARISNALSFQSQTHSLLGSDLVGWWNFNEGLGTTARDISGYDNHGTIVGATYVGGVPGTGGTALEFNGVDNHVTTGVLNPDLRDEDYLTFVAWIKRDTNSSGTSGLGIRYSWWWEVGMTFDSSTLYVLLRNDNGTSSINTGLSLDYNWNLIIMTYNRNTGNWQAWVNNDFNSGTSIIASAGQGDFRIGRLGSNPNNFFHGLIDDVRIYNRALTASEIQTLYAQAKDKYLANE